MPPKPPSMRLFLLPISTRRSLIYCEPIAHANPGVKPSLVDRAVTKASTTWLEWEKDTKAPWQWKKRITDYGNVLFRRIPFEEWGLKSIPPLNKKVAEAYKQAAPSVEVRFPRLYQDLCHRGVMESLQRIATERQALHRRRMRWSIIAMPFTAPVAILPVIPNLPFFYLVFRAWSHWRALRGSQHLEYLLKENTVTAKASVPLDSLYTAGLLHPSLEASKTADAPSTEQTHEVLGKLRRHIGGEKEGPSVAEGKGEAKLEESEADEVLLLRNWNGQMIAEKLELPGLQVELERAVEQVQNSIQKARAKHEQERQQEDKEKKP